MKQDSCWLCGSEQLNDLYIVNGFTVTKCEQCTLCFVREMLDDDVVKQQYTLTSGQNERLATKKIYLDEGNEKNLKYVYKTLSKKIKAHFPPALAKERRKILDLGCSTGVFLDFFPDWDVYGVELEETAATLAKQKHQNIIVGNMKDTQFNDDFFDCITILDALDHSNDPIDVMRRCYRQLKQNGTLIVKVHDIECLMAKLSGKRYYAIMPPVHLTFFSLKTLKRLLSACGFTYSGHHYHWQKIRLDTAILRASATFPFLGSVYEKVSGCSFGKTPIYKNFHDIVTVIAVKK